MDRTTLILAVLQQLHAIHPNGMRAADLCVGVRRMGHPNETPQSIASLLADIEGKGLVSGKPDALDGAVIIYARTEEGRVQLARNGLA